jgi:hypothetical protein
MEGGPLCKGGKRVGSLRWRAATLGKDELFFLLAGKSTELLIIHV